MEIIGAPKVGVRRGETCPLGDQNGIDLLDVADLVLRLDAAIAEELKELDADAEAIRVAEDANALFAWVPEAADKLDRILASGNSVYRVARHARPLRLIQPLGPTVTTMVASAIEQADPTAADHLHDAWVAAYAREPGTDGRLPRRRTRAPWSAPSRPYQATRSVSRRGA